MSNSLYNNRSDLPKVVKLLRLMKLLTGNVNRSIDQLAVEMGTTTRTIYRYIDSIREAGFVVNKLYGNVFAMGKVSRGLTDFNRLIYFTDEEAYITARLIEGIDNNNALKRDLQRKLASVYDSTSIANYIDNAANASNIEALTDAIKNRKQVILKQYESAHSDEAKDRLVEPIEFTTNMIDVWAYDVDKGENRILRSCVFMPLRLPIFPGSTNLVTMSVSPMYSVCPARSMKPLLLSSTLVRRTFS